MTKSSSGCNTLSRSGLANINMGKKVISSLLYIDPDKEIL